MEKLFLGNKNIASRILDIGARYGIHPKWKYFTGEKLFFLVEPDKKEFLRLKKKYKNNKNIKIYSDGISFSNQKIYLNVYENPAMSSTLKRSNLSPLFWREKKNQLIVKKKIKINCLSLDSFLLKNKMIVDFLKIDVEGLEPSILANSKLIFKSLIGLRSEVCFNDLFNIKGKPHGTFNEIHEIMVKNKFVLLNLDYDGKGDFYHKNISPYGKYGVLQNTDAVWIKDPKLIIKYANEIYTLKFISFLLIENGIDIAIYILEKTFRRFNYFKKTKKTKIFNFIKISILKHLYDLKWIPGQNIKTHKKIFEKIFQEKYLSMNEYNENNEINPY